jgi:outer membrane biosynthesis protein TonB
LPASPRTAILPPLAKVPGSVAGRTYRIRFSVAADGRVTRVEVDPPIADDAYRREFLERMQAYQFYPARTRDGRNVASVVTVPLRIGH